MAVSVANSNFAEETLVLPAPVKGKSRKAKQKNLKHRSVQVKLSDELEVTFKKYAVWTQPTNKPYNRHKLTK